MTEQISGLNERVVVSHKQDGRCCYDPQAKRELIEASLQPGVSVAKLALMHGINANLLRKWIGKHLGQSFAGSSVKRTAERPAAFIPVVPVSAHRSPITSLALAYVLPSLSMVSEESRTDDSIVAHPARPTNFDDTSWRLHHPTHLNSF